MTEQWPERLFDMHSHWGTKRGYRLRSEDELGQQPKVWKSEPKYVTEEEMAAYLRKLRVRAILDLGFTKKLPIAEAREFHDYALDFQRSHPDVVYGNWLNIDPRQQEAALAEIRRCKRSSAGFVGFMVSGGSVGVAASDPLFDPFYRLCSDEGIPVLILVGFTGSGAGLPGGGGVLLDLCHPRHIDAVAARYPDLRIVAGRPAWPWQDEMIAILLHKPNVWYELHGWSPKHLTDGLKRDISRRLKDRVMFGADYPLFTYERLVADWRADGYAEDVLANVFHRNAERFFGITS